MSAPMGGVAVGVSPTTGSPAALRWAAQEARLRGMPLTAVMAWRAPRPPAAPGGRPPASAATMASDDYEVGARQTLTDFVETALGSADGVHLQVVRGSAVKALLTSAQHAQLLVVGEPRPGRMGSVRTSLVAPQVVLRAPCPVVVMPAGAAGKVA